MQPGDHSLRFAGSGDSDQLIDEIEDFLTGASRRRDPQRVLATILLAETADNAVDRVTAQAQPAEILVSRTVKDLVVGSGISFADHGSHELTGTADKWPLFAVTGL